MLLNYLSVHLPECDEECKSNRFYILECTGDFVAFIHRWLLPGLASTGSHLLQELFGLKLCLSLQNNQSSVPANLIITCMRDMRQSCAVLIIFLILIISFDISPCVLYKVTFIILDCNKNILTSIIYMFFHATIHLNPSSSK